MRTCRIIKIIILLNTMMNLSSLPYLRLYSVQTLLVVTQGSANRITCFRALLPAIVRHFEKCRQYFGRSLYVKLIICTLNNLPRTELKNTKKAFPYCDVLYFHMPLSQDVSSYCCLHRALLCKNLSWALIWT